MAIHKPVAVLVGFIGKYPVAGMTLYNLHHIVGLQALGYDVHYIERQNVPDEYYDPITDGWDILKRPCPGLTSRGGAIRSLTAETNAMDRTGRHCATPWIALISS
jgi:hypothetical protein